jgi:hypothetical protein
MLRPRVSATAQEEQTKSDDDDFFLISLFDGTSTTLTTVSDVAGKPPKAAILAEIDNDIRYVAANKHGLAADADVWQYNKYGVSLG